MKVKIKKLNPLAQIPKYQTSSSAGFDFHSVEMIEIFPGQTYTVDTGLALEIPEGYELQIRPRSGLSLKTKLRVANSPGTIDSDFRGQICIICNNIDYMGGNPIKINIGDRIAQGIIAPILQAEFEEVEELSQTNRGEGGFGSTDKR